MNPAIFILHGELPADRYLLGHWKWAYDVQVTGFLVDVIPPLNDRMTLAVEVAGELTDYEVQIEPGFTRVVTEKGFNFQVDATNSLRLKVVEYEGALEDAANHISVTIRLTSNIPVPAASLTVRYFGQDEYTRPTPIGGTRRYIVTLWNYDPLTRNFSETEPGISTGRASITKNGDVDISFSIEDQEVFKVQNGIFYANEFDAVTGTSSREFPRLQFCIDDVPILQVSKLSLRAADLIEQSPPVLTAAPAFEFYSNYALTGYMNAQSLIADSFTEL